MQQNNQQSCTEYTHTSNLLHAFAPIAKINAKICCAVITLLNFVFPPRKLGSTRINGVALEISEKSHQRRIGGLPKLNPMHLRTFLNVYWEELEQVRLITCEFLSEMYANASNSISGVCNSII